MAQASSSQSQNEPSTQAALEALTGLLSTPLEGNDLGRLAQMHTHAQMLAGVGAEIGAVGNALALLLEGIILQEAADADGGLKLIPQAVDAMTEAAGGAKVATGPIVSALRAAATGEVVAETPAESAAAENAAVEGAARADETVGEVSAAEVAPVFASSVAEPEVGESAEAVEAGVVEGLVGGSAVDAGGAVEVEAYVAEPLFLDMSEKEHLLGFVDESAEHMDVIETGLLEIEQHPTDTGKINELFRPIHTIKGIAGFLNLRDINRLTHEVETILDLGRKQEMQLTAPIIDLIFSAVDVLKRQMSSLGTFLHAPNDEPVPQPDIVEMMAKLQRTARGDTGGLESGPAISATEAGEAVPQDGLPPRSTDNTNSSGQELEKRGGDAGGGSSGSQDASIRVDTGKLDAMVDAVGELVIAQTMVGEHELIGEDEKLSRYVSQVTKIVRDIQESAMAMRMVPIGQTFQKMRRVVRDVARKAGKTVELTITGEETELDKNVIQAISDPLVHMVRNAVDHGVESPAEREKVGKDGAGHVELNAYHQGDSIVIEIRDDGRGLDREVLLRKGIERGLVSPGDQLSDQQVFALIFQAGFSTAKAVSDISGRGVGMDVVRRNIEKLRGKIEIQSEKGKGSVFMIRLPLTLAIIDGMLVRVGDERVIIPTILIEQSLHPQAEQITIVQRRGMMVRVRGELLPLVQLGALFDYGLALDPCESVVVVVHTEGRKIGVIVDEILGQQQVVIKSLGDRFKHIRGTSGAAILGDGRVGLILEPTGLLKLHNETSTAMVIPKPRVVEAEAEAEGTARKGTDALLTAEAARETTALSASADSKADETVEAATI